MRSVKGVPSPINKNTVESFKLETGQVSSSVLDVEKLPVGKKRQRAIPVSVAEQGVCTVAIIIFSASAIITRTLGSAAASSIAPESLHSHFWNATMPCSRAMHASCISCSLQPASRRAHAFTSHACAPSFQLIVIRNAQDVCEFICRLHFMNTIVSFLLTQRA